MKNCLTFTWYKNILLLLKAHITYKFLIKQFTLKKFMKNIYYIKNVNEKINIIS